MNGSLSEKYHAEFRGERVQLECAFYVTERVRRESGRCDRESGLADAEDGGNGRNARSAQAAVAFRGAFGGF